MSTYNGRRAPNVSQYLRDLNSINPQDATAEESFNMEDDLALFTNTQFFDFDSGQNTDFQAQPVKVDLDASRSVAPGEDVTSAAASVMGEMPELDFMSGEFNFTDFTSGYPAPSMTPFPDGSQNFQPLQPGHGPVFPNQGPQHQPRQQQQHPQQPHHYSQQNGSHGADKRKAESVTSSSPVTFEDASRHAAEEDKRRRNTAASARFRIKKKQREQALEKSAKEMSDKVSSLESKVSQLETENKWLKNLLVEKNDGNNEVATMWKEFTKQAAEKKLGKETGRASQR